MKQRYKNIGIEMLCGLFGKTRYAYYDAAYRSEERVMEAAIIIKVVEEYRKKMPKIGTRKLFYLLEPDLEKHNIKIGRDRLFDLLATYGLLLKKKRRRAITTNSNHWYRKYANLIENIEIIAPEQVWVSDITYLSLPEGFCYLSLVTDAYSRKIVGYTLYRTLESEGSIRALLMAISDRQDDGQLIHHSDRGIQYCCTEYVSILKKQGIYISMTQNGDPYENAIAERINGILKTEFNLHETFVSFEAAQQSVKDAIVVYNEMRPHASCNYLTPSQAHKMEGELNKRWKTYYYSNNKQLENDAARF